MKVLIFLLAFLLQSRAHPYTVFQENGKVGLKNDDGEVIIPARYENIGWSNGKFSVVNNVTGCQSGNLWGLISLSNQRITKTEFDALIPAGPELIVASRRSPTSLKPMTGVLSSSGKEVIPFIYDGVSIESLRAIVFTKIGNQYRYGLIDLSNKTIIPQQYQEIRSIGTLRYAVRNFEGKLALFTESGKQISPFSIDSISTFQKDYAILYEGKYQGLIDRHGEIKLPAKYRTIEILDDGKIRAREPDKWKFLTGENAEIKMIPADSVNVIEAGLYKVETAGQVQLTDVGFKPVMQGAVSRIGTFHNGRAQYALRHLSGVMQKDGTVIVPALYREIRVGKDFILANSGSGDKKAWILFDSAGSRKTTRVYDEMTPFAEGIFLVRNKLFCGLVDNNGKEIVKVIYDSIVQARDNYFVVKFQGLHGVIDRDERWIVTPRANRVHLLGQERFLEFSPSSVNLKSIKGGVIYFTANKIEPHDGYILEFLPSGNIWKIDFNGVIVERQLIPAEPAEIVYAESEGLRAVKRNGRFGFVDSQGRLRIANRYEAVQPFRGGYAPVRILGKWGFINMQDNLSVQPVYEEVWPFQNGRALVRQKGMYGMIDVNGKLILPVRYETIETLSTGNLLVRLNNLAGLSDPAGRMLVTPRYDDLTDTGKGYVVVMRDNRFGVISVQGVNTVPMDYDFIRYDPHENQFLCLKRSAWITLTP